MEKFLRHESAHVAQQATERVQHSTEVSGMPANDNESPAHEADGLSDS